MSSSCYKIFHYCYDENFEIFRTKSQKIVDTSKISSSNVFLPFIYAHIEELTL